MRVVIPRGADEIISLVVGDLNSNGSSNKLTRAFEWIIPVMRTLELPLVRGVAVPSRELRLASLTAEFVSTGIVLISLVLASPPGRPSRRGRVMIRRVVGRCSRRGGGIGGIRTPSIRVSLETRFLLEDGFLVIVVVFRHDGIDGRGGGERGGLCRGGGNGERGKGRLSDTIDESDEGVDGLLGDARPIHRGRRRRRCAFDFRSDLRVEILQRHLATRGSEGDVSLLADEPIGNGNKLGLHLLRRVTVRLQKIVTISARNQVRNVRSR